MKLTFTIALLLGSGCVTTAAEGEPARAAGRVQHLRPSEHVMVIEEIGTDGHPNLVEVETREAEVVRVARDPVAPWRWQAHPARLARLPAGTLVVVIGRAADSGRIDAHRIEIPEADGE